MWFFSVPRILIDFIPYWRFDGRELYYRTDGLADRRFKCERPQLHIICATGGRGSFRTQKVNSVIEEGDRISARFPYDGTLTNLFMGYRPNGAPVQLRSIDTWRVQDGKFVEHSDELNLLEVFQRIGAATVRKTDGQ